MRDPGATGVKITPMAHDCPAVRLVLQVFELTLKSPVIGGLVVLMISVCVGSVFVTVTVCAALGGAPNVIVPKLSEVGETESCTNVPKPCRLTLWGLLVASSTMVTTPVCEPYDAGVNVTVIVQVVLAPPAGLSRAPQVFVSENSAEPVMLVILRVAGPVL
jgi:hypothetical protein